MSAAAQDMQKKAFTRWMNHSLVSRGRKVNDIFVDLQVSAGAPADASIARPNQRKKKEKKIISS